MHYGLYLSVVLLKLFLCIMMILMNWYENILKFEYIEVVINVLFREKFLRLTMGFGYFMYSHSLVPVIDLWVRVMSKVLIYWYFYVIVIYCMYVVFIFKACYGFRLWKFPFPSAGHDSPDWVVTLPMLQLKAHIK